MQRKNRGSIFGTQTVLKASTDCVDAVSDVLVSSNVKSGDCELPNIDKSCASLAYSDHVYCRIETADERASLSDQPVEPVTKDSNMNAESTPSSLQLSSVSYVKTESVASDELSLSYPAIHSHSSSDETSSAASIHCPSAVTVESLDAASIHCPSAVTTQSLDVTSTQAETSYSLSELDVADTEDVSLGSSAASGTSDSGVGTVSPDEASCMTDKSKQLTDSVTGSDNCEVVDLTDGRSLELECQCGAHDSDPSDKLHVVECQRCHSYQHAVCVNYDLTDPLRGDYLCPHCHIVEVRYFQSYVCHPKA